MLVDRVQHKRNRFYIYSSSQVAGKITSWDLKCIGRKEAQKDYASDLNSGAG